VSTLVFALRISLSVVRDEPSCFPDWDLICNSSFFPVIFIASHQSLAFPSRHNTVRPLGLRHPFDDSIRHHEIFLPTIREGLDIMSQSDPFPAVGTPRRTPTPDSPRSGMRRESGI